MLFNKGSKYKLQSWTYWSIAVENSLGGVNINVSTTNGHEKVVVVKISLGEGNGAN